MKFYCLILFAALVTTSSCSKDDDNPQELIVGKWIIDKANSNTGNVARGFDFYIFRDNGTVSMGYAPSDNDPLNVYTSYYEVAPILDSGDYEYRSVSLRKSPTDDWIAQLMKYDEYQLIIPFYPSDLFIAYRRISDWRETGYPDHIIDQMPE